MISFINGGGVMLMYDNVSSMEDLDAAAGSSALGERPSSP